MGVEEAVLQLTKIGGEVGMDKQDPSCCAKRATVKEREIRGSIYGGVQGVCIGCQNCLGRKEGQGGQPAHQEPQAWLIT